MKKLTVENVALDDFYLDVGTAFRVQGIEDWIQGLLKIQEVPYDTSGATMLRMVDSKTGAVFLVARIK